MCALQRLFLEHFSSSPFYLIHHYIEEHYEPLLVSEWPCADLPLARRYNAADINMVVRQVVAQRSPTEPNKYIQNVSRPITYVSIASILTPK